MRIMGSGVPQGGTSERSERRPTSSEFMIGGPALADLLREYP